MSQLERTGWRDGRFSLRHRAYGQKLSMIDLDEVWVEKELEIKDTTWILVKGDQPCALIEAKEEHAMEFDKTKWQIRVLINLAKMAGLPLFFIRYEKNFDWLSVVPLNDKAEIVLPKRKKMSEMEYVQLEYRIRGYTPLSDNDTCGDIGWGLVENKWREIYGAN